jgi:hypothetical protein
MYQPYPGGSQPPEPYARPAAPQPVIRAAQVMYAGAAASLIGIVINVLNRHAIRTALLNHDKTLTAAKLNDAYHVALGALVVAGLIGVGLWIWMALMCKAGRSWARILSSVFFGIDTVYLIAGSAVPGGGSLTTRLYGILIWAIGLAAIVLLWRPESTAFFRGTARR